MNTLVLIPAYGVDYETESETLEAWNGGKDFLIRTLEVRGSYASIRDIEYIKEDYDQVYIRYNKEMDIVVVYEKES